MFCPHCKLPLPDNLPAAPFSCSCGGFFEVLAGEAVVYEPSMRERALNLLIRAMVDRKLELDEQRRKAMMN